MEIGKSILKDFRKKKDHVNEDRLKYRHVFSFLFVVQTSNFCPKFISIIVIIYLLFSLIIF